MRRFMVKTMKLNKFCLITGKDILFENSFYIHSPTIEELGSHNIQEEDWLKALRVITITKSVLQYIPEGKEDVNMFFFFVAVLANPNLPELEKHNIITVLKLILNRYEIMLVDKGIMLLNKDNKDETYLINETNFEIFQSYLKEIFCLDKFFSEEQEYNVKSEKAKRIAAQLQQRHKILNEKKGLTEGSTLNSYISILAIGVGIPLENLVNKTIYQIFYLLDRYTLYYNVDLDLRCRLAGGSSEKEMDNWMKII